MKKNNFESHTYRANYQLNIQPILLTDFHRCRKNGKRTYGKTLQRSCEKRKKPAEKHRELILKWQKQGRRATLLTLYETAKDNSQRGTVRLPCNERRILLRFRICTRP